MKNSTMALKIQPAEAMPTELPIGWLAQPSGLTRFRQTGTDWDFGSDACPVQVFFGELQETAEDRVCPYCGCESVYVHGRSEVTLKHLGTCIMQQKIEVSRNRYRCRACGKTFLAEIPFQADGHRLTLHKEQLIERCLQVGFTLKETSIITGVDAKIVEEIDLRRLKDLYKEVCMQTSDRPHITECDHCDNDPHEDSCCRPSKSIKVITQVRSKLCQDIRVCIYIM